jgi:hypothetical protein
MSRVIAIIPAVAKKRTRDAAACPLWTFGFPEELGDDVRVQLFLGHRYLLPPIASAGLRTGHAAAKTLWIGRSAWHP